MDDAMAPITSTPPIAIRRQWNLSQVRWWVWLILIAAADVLLFVAIARDELYSFIFSKLQQGIVLTLSVTLVAYFSALVIGLIVSLGRVSKNIVIYNLATLYVQIIRGVPILVQIFFVTFVATPAFFELLNAIGAALSGVLGPDNFLVQTSTQDVSLLARAVIALTVAYGGYEAETFRAGIESIGRGQMEAARSLGMSYFQAMRYVILPQAVRNVLPPLGNDFISMLKDSSLVSVLGVRDITQEARLYVAASFRYPETYYMLAFMYLNMTIPLSLAVRWLEGRMGSGRRAA
jgi:polar amino acid transport system permease protein